MTNQPQRQPLPADLHPSRRLIAQGAAALSNAELLAVILRTGTGEETAVCLAERILDFHHGLSGLAQANPADLEKISGLTSTRISQIIASLELGRRLSAAPLPERPLINSAADAARCAADLAGLTQEHVRVILLDSGRRVIAAPTVYIGTMNLSVLRIGEIYREAIAQGSAGIILTHNHPSGDPMPSPEDVELTRALAAAGSLLDIPMIDHVIIGRQGWVSLREQGFLG